MDCLLEQFRLVLVDSSRLKLDYHEINPDSYSQHSIEISCSCQEFCTPWEISGYDGSILEETCETSVGEYQSRDSFYSWYIITSYSNTYIGEYLSTFSEGQDIDAYFSTLSQLFSTLESRKARLALVAAFGQFGYIDKLMQPLISNLVDLNTYSFKRLDEPDFETKFTAFKLVASTESSFSPRYWLALVHNFLYNLRDIDEYSVRTAAVECMLRLVDLAAAPDGDMKEAGALSYLDIVIYTLLPEIKKGLKFNSEVVRKEFVIVLAALITKLPNHRSLTDMSALLAGGDDEANFFSNIYHPQIHRRERALRRLSKECETISPGNINSIFIPIASHFVFESNLAERHQLVNEAVNALSALANSLPWGQYYRLILRYFDSLKKKPHLEHIVIRVVVAILESFHFKVFTIFMSNPLLGYCTKR
jgi:U3 small nucleolar RNA-associated protein 20